MANLGGIRGGIGQRTRSRDHVVQEFVPSSAWTEDPDGHYLLIDLPDFQKDEVRLQVDNESNITVSGERLVNHNKYVYFEQTYKMPENSDIDKISGKFDGEILYVTVPKLVVDKGQEPDIHAATDSAQDQNPASRDENSKENGEPVGDGHQQTASKGKMNNCLDSFHKVILDKLGREASPLDMAINMVKNNKALLVTAVIAFSLGVLISHNKFESSAGQ
ncbi:hypothetical protein Tsubulata_050446 [Turnera subulata]|uniref:SHSP domain-containing protein n=1 Tax=Turnera subulata TaxID=218843 RepID=A0A9Q0G0E3_9ROSI|nr:hypothetical protein Tsubulata_050446 [Turnera subulata]